MSRWRAVVGCGEGLARSGLVRIGCAGGHFEILGFAVGGLAGGGVCHTLVPCGAKRGGTQGDTLRRFLQVGGRGGTGTGEHGFSLTGGQVVAGSNPVSPTTVMSRDIVDRCPETLLASRACFRVSFRI